MRHNHLRDLNMSMQKEVCRDVVSEPRLLPITDQEVDGTTADRAAREIFISTMVEGISSASRRYCSFKHDQHPKTADVATEGKRM